MKVKVRQIGSDGGARMLCEALEAKVNLASGGLFLSAGNVLKLVAVTPVVAAAGGLVTCKL